MSRCPILDYVEKLKESPQPSLIATQENSEHRIISNSVNPDSISASQRKLLRDKLFELNRLGSLLGCAKDAIWDASGSNLLTLGENHPTEGCVRLGLLFIMIFDS
jgi:hypothetical protein